MEPISGAKVLQTINRVTNYVKQHNSNLSSRLYDAMDGMSRIALTYKETQGAPGWASKAKNAEGKPIWSKQEAEAFENLVETKLKELEEVQAGGDPVTVESPGPTLSVTPKSSLVTLPVASTFSIDEIYENVRGYLDLIDTKNRELASILGPVAIVKHITEDYTKNVEIPFVSPIYPFYTNLSIPPRMILPMIESILELCRLIVSTNILDIEILRKILSLVLAIFDVTRGDWRNGIFSFLGFFGRETMRIGQSLKTAKWVYNFISPDIQRRIEDDLFAGGKSVIAGCLLWFASIISPGIVQRIVNNMIEVAKQPVEELNQKFEEIQVVAQKSAAKIGATVTFPKFPLAQFPSFDDIQNFQSIVHQPEVFCSTQFQTALAPALEVPVLRVLLEMMNVPTTVDSILKTCRGQTSTIEENLLKEMIPTVTMNGQAEQTQVGGVQACTPEITPRTMGAVAGDVAMAQALRTRLSEIDNPNQEKPQSITNQVASTIAPITRLGASAVGVGAQGTTALAEGATMLAPSVAAGTSALADVESALADVEDASADAIDLTSCTIKGAKKTIQPAVKQVSSTIQSLTGSATAKASDGAAAIVQPAVKFVQTTTQPIIDSMNIKFKNPVSAITRAGTTLGATAESVSSNIANTTDMVYTDLVKPITKESASSVKEAVAFSTPIVGKLGANVSKSANSLADTASNIKEGVIDPIVETVETGIQSEAANAAQKVQEAQTAIHTLNTSLKTNALRNKTAKLYKKTGKLGASFSKLKTAIQSVVS